MSSNVDDDFWNRSSASAFNFDEDDDFDQSFKESVFNSSTEENIALPIHTIISKTGLDLILDDIKSTHETIVPPVEETIKKMLYNQKYSLEQYKKLSEKLLLLDSAIETFDGNVIMNVILFLKTTLKPSIFYHQISKRKVALNHYANYLIINSRYLELIDMYMATGNSSKMVELFYLIGKDVSSKDLLYKKLKQFMSEHLQTKNSDDLELNNLKFLEWQIMKQEKCDSVIEQLAQVCKKELSANKTNTAAIMDFKKSLKIDDFSFEWTILNTMAYMELWTELYNFFVKPNWLTKKSVLKSVINPELFVMALSRHKTPKNVIEQYLPFVSDTEECLGLAQTLEYHKFVVQHFINKKDRVGLANYKSKLAPQCEEYFMVENALQSIHF